MGYATCYSYYKNYNVDLSSTALSNDEIIFLQWRLKLWGEKIVQFDRLRYLNRRIRTLRVRIYGAYMGGDIALLLQLHFEHKCGIFWLNTRAKRKLIADMDSACPNTSS